MPVRDRIADQLARLAKRFGTAEPAAFLEGEQAAGMDTSTAFGPGKPLLPYDGYSRTPRSHQFTPQHNVSARPRSHERIAFSTLQGLIDSYDFAQICIWHRIDSIRSLERSLVAADGYEGDVTDAVKIGEAFLKKPDRETPFDAWLAEYLYDVLAYDAGTLSRMRDGLGRTVGLRTVDGTTIAPLLDNWGNTPQYPAEAYVQYINGLPWNWLTDRDLIYRPFRKRSNSPYGHAPMESLLLNANTDLRFQAYFLQRFTDGNIPRAFASAPESWTPDQIEGFQQAWDALMRGDQEILSQIKWIPGGGAIAWSDEKEFSDTFSLFMMRKTAAGYHVVPADLGFTETVNRSTGETQSDVQHRLGDTPLAKHVDGLITSVLQDDLGLPIQHKFDLGEEQDDRLQTAQSDFIYWRMGSVGTSEVREMRFGLGEADGKPVPRTFFTERSGPIPISALEAVAGPVDQLTGAPEPGVALPTGEFLPVEGTLPNPPPDTPPLAEQIYGPSAVAGIPQPPGVAKDAAASGPTAGITAATGIYGYDLVGQDDEDDEDDEPATPVVVKAAQVRAAELAAFRRFAKARRREGKWRDFQFTAIDPQTAAHLNTEARAGIAPRIAKADTVVPGLTKRSGMISLDLPDGAIPAVPGGVGDHHITVVYLGKNLTDEQFAGACRRAQAAAANADGPLCGTVYGLGTFPPSDGSDGMTPAFAKVDLPGVQNLRADLADLSASEHTDYHPHVTLAYLAEGDTPPEPVAPTAVVFTHLTVHCGEQAVSYPLGAVLAKAGGAPPKAPPPAEGEPAAQAWPGWQLDLAAAAYWAPLIATALTDAISPETLAQAYLGAHPGIAQAEGETKAEQVKRLTAEAQEWVQTERAIVEQALDEVMPGVWSDGYLIGATSAKAVIEAAEDGQPLAEAVAEVGDWVVGDTEAAQLLLGELGDGAGLRKLLDQAEITIKSVADSRLDELGRALAQGAANGDSADTIAKAITDVLSNPARAHMIATTELCRAVSAATAQEYGKRGVAEVNWSTAFDDRVCPRCDANEAVGDHPLGEPFPSGAAYPPQHPMCRCALLPAITTGVS